MPCIPLVHRLSLPSTSRLRPCERHCGFKPSPGANGGANRERTPDRLQPLAHAEQPETGVAVGVDVESCALISDDQYEPVGCSAQMDRDLARRTVFDGVPQALLGDAKQAQGNVARKPGRHSLVGKVDRDLMLRRELASQAFDGRDETNQLELGWVQLVREIVNAGRNPGRAIRGVMGALQGVRARRVDGVTKLFELDRQQRQLLADVVVQFARDARPLGFLRGDQPAGEIADPGVAAAKLCLALEDALFGLAALPSVHQQAGDEQRLYQQHRECANDVELVALPGGRLTKLDRGSGRDASLADVPATELPPVDLVDMRIDLGCRDTVGALAAEHAQRLLGGELDGALEAEQAPAYETVVQPHFHKRVERRIRGRGRRDRASR